MPGSVSDNYDPEWGTGSNQERIAEALQSLYLAVSNLVGNPTPIFVLGLLDIDLPQPVTATFSVKQWRLIRFALERAKESL